MPRFIVRPFHWSTAILPAALSAAPALAAPAVNDLDFLQPSGPATAWATMLGEPGAQSATKPAGPPAGAPATATLAEPTTSGTPGAAPPPVARAEPDFMFHLGGGYLHQFIAATDSTGQMSADRFYASMVAHLITTESFKFTLSMGYEYDWYSWKGKSSLGAQAPFQSVNLFALQARATFKLSPEWSVGVSGVFGIAGETDADMGSSLYGGGIGSVAWTPNQDLMLGLGLLVVTQIEDDVLIIPIPLIYWKFSEEWVVTTMHHPPASPFVGVDLEWEPTGSPLDASLGIAWQDRRFRLGTSAIARMNRGVGEDQSWALLADVGWDINKSMRLDFTMGLNFYEQLIVENSVGGQQRSLTMDPSFMAGLFFTLKF